MIGPQTARNAIRRARESIEGVDRTQAVRVSFAFLLALITITSASFVGADLSGSEVSIVGMVSAQGAVFTYSGDGNGNIHKIDTNGNNVWTYSMGVAEVDGLAADASGNVYAGEADSTNSELHKINKTGNLVWKYTEHSGNIKDVDIGPDGFIYTASTQDEQVHKIDEDGDNVWKFDAADQVWAVAVGPNGNVYLGTGGPSYGVYKVDQDGNQVWKYSGHSSTVQALAVDSDGNVYSGSKDDEVHKIDSNGNNVWTYTEHTDFIWSAGVDSSKNAYSGSADNELHKINTSGGNVWKYTEHTGTIYGVAVGPNDNIFTGSSDNEVHKVDSSGNQVWNYTGHSSTVFSVAVTEVEQTISGDVKDANGNGIEDAVVTVNDSNATGAVTDSTGFYEVTVPSDGTYKLTAQKNEYTSESINVTLSGGESKTNQDITLFDARELFIDTNTQLCHGESADYSIDSIFSDKPGATQNDVTENATLTSSDDDVLEVDDDNHTITATTNPDIQQVVTLTAEYENASETKGVFVGDKTVDNIDKFENGLDALVGLWGNSACREGEDPPGGTQLTMLWIFASLSAAIVVTRFSTTFGGVGAFAVVMTMGWFIGGVGEGMIMLTWAFGIFLGLNVATNFQSFKR